MKRLAIGLAALTLVIIGAAAGWFARSSHVSPSAVAQIRIVTIQQHLDEADPGSVLLAGDSNVALESPAEPICGKPTVNAGISGATASSYLALMSELTFPARPGMAVLTIGTNDLNRANDPGSPQSADRFAEDAGQIVAKLRALTDRVVVTAIPPLSRDRDESYDASQVEPYSQRLKALCAFLGCTYADPFASLRDGHTGFGLPGANRDGVHLARYRPILRALSAILCPDDP